MAEKRAAFPLYTLVAIGLLFGQQQNPKSPDLDGTLE